MSWEGTGFRRTLVLSGAALLTFTLFFSEGPWTTWPRLRGSSVGPIGVTPFEALGFRVLVAFLPQLTAALAAILLVGAALVIGRRLLPVLGAESEDEAENALFGFAFGLGLLSLTTLAVGATLGFNRWLFVGALVVLSLFSLGCVASPLGSTGRLWPSSPPGIDRWLLLLGFASAAALLVLAALAAFVPAIDYDALVYHLAVPAAYLRAGRIVALPGNVYSNFPLGSEMLTLLAMVVTGDPGAGASAGRLLTVAIGLALAVAAGLCGRRFFGPTAGAVASVTLLLVPFFTRYAARAYDTISLSFVTFLTVYAGCGLVTASPEKRRPWLMRASVCAGLALGTKYTSGVFVLAPLLALGLLRPSVPWRERAKETLCLGAIPLAMVAPWLVKNVLVTGNPVFPFLNQIFRSPMWDPILDARFWYAHTAAAPGPRDLLLELSRMLVLGADFSPLFVVFLLPALFASSGNRRALVVLAAFVASWSFLWAFTTHRLDRFLAPMVPPLAVLLGAGFAACLSAGPRILARLVLCLGLAAHLHQSLSIQASLDGMSTALGLETPEAYLERMTRGLGLSAEAIFTMNRSLGPGARVLFLGEAETFLSTHAVVASTVFDRQLLDVALGTHADSLPPLTVARVDEAVRSLRRWGITHVYVSWPEVVRLQTWYAFPYAREMRPGCLFCLPLPRPLSGEKPGALLARFVDEQYGAGLFSPPLLGRHLDPVKTWGPATANGSPYFALYALRGDRR